LMRSQLAVANESFITRDSYSELFTMHGTTMVFLVVMPIGAAFMNYLIPLQVGARDVAFPRLNAFGFWSFLFGGVVLNSAWLLGGGADGGWFNYAPNNGVVYSPTHGIDFWNMGLLITGLASLSGAVNLIVTCLNMRAPGMTLMKMPLFVWTWLITAYLLIAVMPVLAGAVTMLLTDRHFGTSFFSAAGGGDPVLFQHVFWFFGHPEVYIIFLPATGFVSEIVATFSRRSVFAYPIVVLSLIATGILAFGLWVHHMFATGLPRVGYAFFTGASMAVSIPTGLQIFVWIATIWLGRPRLEVPMLYVVAFLITFVIGGLSGVMIAAVPLDLQLHDTYFIVAHFHYVLIGGAVFPLLGAITYWFPKATGRMMSETLGKISFWMIFLGFQLTFFPMHIAGLMGMPRRVYTYPAGMGLELPNLLSTIGSLVVASAVLLFVVNLVRSFLAGRAAGPNPWDAPTLEWATASPPPSYNFAHVPLVEGRTPLWDRPDELAVAHGLRVDDRELLLTTVLEAEPDVREPSAEPSPWPFIAAAATTVMFIGSIFSPWALLVGAAPATIALIAWFWPKDPEPGPEPVIS
ncbi:MAG TPA: cbb3-type cytochrome c oxidase subunit I, partial [Sphingomicrobium sp.]